MVLPNRYQDLLAQVPTGSFYASSGEILPKRSTPYEFRFETDTPLTQYAVFVSGVEAGLVATDIDGVAVVSVVLDIGEHVLQLKGAGRTFETPVTIRNYATWLAAHAQVMERLDALTLEARQGLSMTTASGRYLGEVYGVNLDQPNDANWLTDAYRQALIELRQGYRLWGARRAGLRQVVQAITAVNPLIVPRAWTSRWILSPEAWPVLGVLDAEEPFPALNARAQVYLLDAASAGTAVNLGPFSTFPRPLTLSVTFDAAYVAGLAGDITVTGLDATGALVSDTFLKPGAPQTVYGTLGVRFASVTRVELDSTGLGTYDLGLRDVRFLRAAQVLGPHVLDGTGSRTRTLTYDVTAGTLALDTGSARVVGEASQLLVPGTTGWSLAGGDGLARIDSRAAHASIAYGLADRLRFRLDGLGVVDVELPASPATPVAVASAMNDALARSTAYDAEPIRWLLTASGNPSDGEIITITDARGFSRDFEADNNSSVAGTSIRVVIGASPQDTLLNLLDAINRSPVLARAYETANPLEIEVDLLEGNTSGSLVNGWTNLANVTLFSGLAASGDYGTGRASTVLVTLPVAATRVVRLEGHSGLEGEDSSVEVLPWPIDAAPAIFGWPGASTALTAGAAAEARTLPVTSNASFPEQPVIIVHDSVADDVAVWPGPLERPSWSTALEVWFSPDYTGGDIEVTGLDCRGEVVSETFAVPPEREFIVDSGDASSDGAQVGGRAANNPGTLASISVIEGPATVTAWMSLAPGTSGNTKQIQILAPSVSYTEPVASYNGTTVAIQLASPTSVNTREALVAALRAIGILAQTAGSAGTFTVAAGPAAFAGGADPSRSIISLSRVPGHATSEGFGPQVRAGMLFVSGANSARILHAGPGEARFPPTSYTAYGAGAFSGAAQNLRLDTGMPAAGLVNAAWAVKQGAVARGSVLMREVTAVRNLEPALSATGRVQLRVLGGVEDYGVAVRVGRGLRASGAGDGAFTTLRSFLSPSWTPVPDEGLLRITNAVAPYYAGANNGAHAIAPLDPVEVFESSGLADLVHGRGSFGKDFQPSHSNPALFESGLDWETWCWGEVVRVVGRTGSTSLTIAEPGLQHSKLSGAAVELDEDLGVRRSGLPEALEGLDLEVESWLAPTTGPTVSDTFDVLQSALPVGWRTYNITGDAAQVGLWGELTPARLWLFSDGGSVLGAGYGPTVEFPVDAPILALRGRSLHIAAWLSVVSSGASVSCAWSVSWDGGWSWTLGATGAITTRPGVASLAGGPAPEVISGSVLVPLTAESLRIRVHTQAALTAGHAVLLERALVSTLRDGVYLGHGTTALDETQAEFGDLLWVWSPAALEDVEENAITRHIAGATEAHGLWAMARLERVVGLYDDAAWAGASFVNMERQSLSPARFGWVSPTRASLVEDELLTITAPSNAALAVTSRHEGVFPQRAFAGERLTADGVPVPSTGYPGTLATAAINGGNIVLTSAELNSVTVDASIASDRPLRAVLVGQDVTVELAVRSGALDGATNRAEIVAATLRKAGIDAEATTPTTLVNAAEGPTSFTGGQPLPWRFLSATSIQIASAAAGDLVADRNYRTGTPNDIDSGVPYYDSGAEHRLTYEALIEALTPTLDAGVDAADFAWFIDASLWARIEPETLDRVQENVPLSFRADGTASLLVASDRDATSAELVADNGIRRTVVSRRQWSFQDAETVFLEPTVFDSNAIYSLSYTGRVANFTPDVGVQVEHRSGASPAAVSAAVWRVVEADELVASDRYHQMRVRFTGVLSASDVRLKGLGLRGVNLYGANPDAPGVIPCDED